MARVALKNQTKRLGDFAGVDNQSIEIADKEFLVLLGSSGCGKTTTMRMIAGLEEPSAGEVWFDNRLVNDDLPKDRDVAMVFQNYGLYPHMTVFEIIAYPLRVPSTPKHDIPARMKKAAEQIELADFLDRKPKALSGGQRQRVALARTIVRTPKVFLMDEPLSNLDAKLRVTMRAELKQLSRELKVTTVYVTRDQIEAMTLAGRVAIMKNGVIQQLGTPDEIYDDPENLFVAGFIGAPAKNLINGAIRGGAFVTAGGTRLVAIDADDRALVVLGVRADEIHVSEPGEGDIDMAIYAFENTGEATLLTLQLHGQRIIAKGDRHLRKDQDEVISVSFGQDLLYLFDPETGARLRG
ncbi:MAG: ABC transporter ATP-binding protein [Pseudomonadota bacterium]